jgi:hypothetical protein
MTGIGEQFMPMAKGKETLTEDRSRRRSSSLAIMMISMSLFFLTVGSSWALAAAPVLAPIGSQTVAEGANLNLTVSATDAVSTLADSEVAAITVDNVNRAPVLVSIGLRSVNERAWPPNPEGSPRPSQETRR